MIRLWTVELIPGRAWREEAIEAELGRRGDGLQSTTTWSVLPLLWLDLYLTKSAVTRTPGRARREEECYEVWSRRGPTAGVVA